MSIELFEYEIYQYFLFIASDECNYIELDEIVWAEKTKEIYTLLDIKQILFN